MESKSKKIEVLVGSVPQYNVPLMNFKGQIEYIFKSIADFKETGGNYHEVFGRFNGRNDEKSYLMNFHCSNDNSVLVLKHIESVFKNVAPEGVRFVSIKVYDLESYSFEI